MKVLIDGVLLGKVARSFGMLGYETTNREWLWCWKVGGEWVLLVGIIVE